MAASTARPPFPAVTRRWRSNRRPGASRMDACHAEPPRLKRTQERCCGSTCCRTYWPPRAAVPQQAPRALRLLLILCRPNSRKSRHARSRTRLGASSPRYRVQPTPSACPSARCSFHASKRAELLLLLDGFGNRRAWATGRLSLGDESPRTRVADNLLRLAGHTVRPLWRHDAPVTRTYVSHRLAANTYVVFDKFRRADLGHHDP